MFAYDPVDGFGRTEHTHEEASCLLILSYNRQPLVQPGPDLLDHIAADVDPDGQCEWHLILRQPDRRSDSHAPDSRTEDPAGVNFISHHAGVPGRLV
jgi:hypothetical protein